MPIGDMDKDQIKAALELTDSDLRFIYEEVGVRGLVQAHLTTRGGVVSLRRLSGFGNDHVEIRAALRDQLGLDATDSIEARNDVSDVLAAWDDAKLQANREAEIRADQKVLDTRAPAPKREVKSMRAAFENVYGMVPNEFCPGRFYLGTKLEEAQDDEPVAEDLTEVSTREDGEEDLLLPEITSDGGLRIKKGKAKKAAQVENSEELRTRYKIMNLAWMFIKMRRRSKTWLKDLAEDSFQKILGDYVLGKKGRGSLLRKAQ